MRKAALTLATLLGLAAAANGAFMLISPEGWYLAVPGVTTTGPFNQHFIRDIGLIFLLLASGLLVGAARRPVRGLLWTAVATWLTGHALFHVWEVAVGICGPSALARDFAAVTLPALLTWGLAAYALRDRA
jgi:hypothetical protein